MVSIEIDNENSEIIVRLPINPKKSSTGKMMLIASSGGWIGTETIYEDQQLRVNATVGYKL
ncbi:hypothetical protein CEE45_12255 [Candidatus Heimdallarchaeota archaeon B3_Heim]|nr:MAG: hypothetical protein CEE45_12255 [Candidatus Heimdallarchaeota archaeon B3_Heim]